MIKIVVLYVFFKLAHKATKYTLNLDDTITNEKDTSDVLLKSLQHSVR